KSVQESGRWGRVAGLSCSARPVVLAMRARTLGAHVRRHRIASCVVSAPVATAAAVERGDAMISTTTRLRRDGLVLAGAIALATAVAACGTNAGAGAQGAGAGGDGGGSGGGGGGGGDAGGNLFGGADGSSSGAGSSGGAGSTVDASFSCPGCA